MQRKYDLETVFRPEKRRIVIGGFYPSTETKQLLLKLSALFNSLVTGIQFSAAIIFLYFNKSDVTNFSEVLLYGTTQFAFVCKLTLFVLSRKEILELEVILKSSLFTQVTPEEEAILKTSKKGIRMTSNIYKSLCVISVTFYALFPLADGGRQHQKLPFPGWFPFSTNHFYYEVYIFEAFGIVVCAWFNSALDLLLVIMMAIGRAQFEILQHRLRNIFNGVDEEEMARRLKRCAQHYKSILRFKVLTESIFSGGIFVQFLSSAVVICFTGFQIVVIPIKSVQFFQRVMYLNTMMCQLVIYCWYGQVFTDSSNKIIEACYMADWLNYNSSLKKSLLIIMERAKIPANIQAGNIFPVNLETLMVILRSSYSYFTLVYRIYSAKN